MATETAIANKNFVGGEWVDAVEGGTMAVINPATGEKIAEVPRGTAADVDRAVEAANRALPEWRVQREMFGTVWINDHIPLTNEMPHCGYKQSGYGKDLSTYSLEDYTQIKHVMAKIS